MTDPKGLVKLLAFTGGTLVLAAAWSAWAGMRLAGVRKQARLEGDRLERVHEALADAAFRTELVEALAAKRQDTQQFRTRLADLARKNGIVLDGSITEARTELPTLGMRQVDAALSFKDVSMSRFLDFARTVEQDMPDAVVSDVTLKPIPEAGDRWEVRMRVSKRQKVQ